MRVLMIGVTSIRYVRENWIEPMRKMYDLTYIPYDTLLRAMGIYRLNRYIADKCKEGYDYVFFYPDGRGQMFSDDLFKMLKDERTIVFHSDDAGGLWFQNCSRFDYRYDFVATSAKEGYIKRTNAEGYKGNATYVPWGYNPDIFFKINGIKKDTDVVFLGSNFERDGEYIHDGEFRQALLTKLYEASVKYNFSLKLYGAGWDRHPILHKCYEGFAEADKVNEMFNRTRIILGLGYTIDKNPTYQTKLKHFENSGTGSFQLVNFNPELEEIFGDSLGYFKDADDMVSQVLYYLDNPDEREMKALRAYDICTNECTMSARIRELFRNAGQFFDYSPSDERNDRMPVKISHQSMDSYKRELCTGDYDYCSIMDDVKCFDWNYTLLPHDIRYKTWTPEVFAVNSYVTFCDPSELDESRIIRRSAGPDTVIIPPCLGLNDNPYSEEIRLHFTCYEDKGMFYPLVNYVFRRDCVLEKLKEIEDGDYSCLINAPKLDCICGDYIIPDEKPVIRRYYDYFEKVFSQNDSVVVYGLFGYVFDMYCRWTAENGVPGNVTYVDKNWAGKIKDGVRCIDLDTLLSGNIVPSVILITAIFSAEEIDKLLQPFKDKAKIVKMYDMGSF